uniref:uncharacterized protein LOC124066389 n=1 Tax=Scatophagus argus TaxID=75038 RepID=UPI001ED7D7B8|nr:uncharacterized protein LOC124066389 [Scatophagus argus]
MQHDAYSEELKCITAKRDLPSHSSLLKLKPSIDSSGLLRVGGRINQTGFEVRETNPLIIPGSHHVTTLLIRHHHERVQHQGRHFTEGAIRESGLWIVGGKRRISSIIRKCVMCRKLRDVFGPWEVTTRRTRGGQANSKRWAVLFTCMCTRAVHIEVIEEMSSSSFINALRRFFAIRGPAKQLRSDRGTNFIGACRELKLDTSEQIKVQGYLEDQRCTWIFNPPHSSHMGGTWERMIGVTRRILDSMLLQSGKARLTHEVLTTLMAEITAIINARPLIPVSSDPEHAHILTPSMLLTQKAATLLAPQGDISEGEMLKYQWKRVQSLADEFWSRWRKEFLSTLQTRQKWQHKRPDIRDGDVVLLKDKQSRRNKWPGSCGESCSQQRWTHKES